MSDILAPAGDPIQALHYAMRQVVSLGASDLHMKAGRVPYVRLNSELVELPGVPALGEEALVAVSRELTRGAPTRFAEFEESGEADVSYELAGVARFRVSLFRQRSGISIALRVVPDVVPALSTLNLPPVIETLANLPRGLVLVTGATGSGKSTTLAAMIDHINATSARHIVTIEDPVEMMHHDKRSLINQREIGVDTASFFGALRRALRQDPDVIMIGEMRDEETVRAALNAAETGHLVFSTLHTIDVMETIYRVLDYFPAALENQARAMLAGTLKGVISQRLVRTADGRSRVPAVEVLVGTSRITDAIIKADETGSIVDAIAEGAYYGMQTFDQSLLQMVLDGAVTVEEALHHASAKQNFALLLEANNVRIGSAMRRAAAGSNGSVQDELQFSPADAPTSPQRRPNPGGSMLFPDVPPAMPPGYQSPAASGPGTHGPGVPRQPRPQPGIRPDLPGHSAA